MVQQIMGIKERKERERGIRRQQIMVAAKKVFSEKRLSVLESVVGYLKEKGLKNSEIAKFLGKDQRNVWTIYSRYKKR